MLVDADGLDLADVAGQFNSRQRVEAQLHLCALADAHHIQLGQVVGLYLPFSQVGQLHHRYTGRNRFAHRGGHLGHRARKWGSQHGLIQRSLGLLHSGAGRCHVCFGRGGCLRPRTGFKQVQLRLRAPQLCLCAGQIGWAGRRPDAVKLGLRLTYGGLGSGDLGGRRSLLEVL